MIFTYIDPDTDENEKALEFFGVEDPEEELPMYMIMEMEKNAKFVSDKSIDVVAEEVKEFCNKHQVCVCLYRGAFYNQGIIPSSPRREPFVGL